MKYAQFITLATLIVLVGCKGSGSPEPMAPPAYLAPQPALMSAAPASDSSPGRAQLWCQTCNRCHNARSPDSYSGNEWALIMTHMRIRGYLTGEDQRVIQQFLQSQ
jgi:hypothetical protein